MTRAPRIGFAGLGLMGRPMATRLADAGFRLAVWNRSDDRSLPFRERGIPVAPSPRELAAQADVVITMLGTSEATRDVLIGRDGVLAGTHKGLTVIDMGSTAPEISTALADACRARGVAMLDSPVSGTVRAAADGGLVVMVGGDEEVYLRMQDILGVFGTKRFHVGSHGAGCRMKLVVNILLSLTAQALAEALAFGAAQGLDPRRVHEVLMATPSSSGVVVRKGQAMVEHDFAPAAPLRLLHKDLGQALAVAQELGVPLPATATANALYATGIALGRAEQDFSAIYAVMEHLLGLSRPSGSKT